MKLLKRILKKEAGQALPMALILLVLGGLLVVPTLAFMTTNLTANRTVDQANLRTYAADAGIQYAYNKFLNDVDPDLPAYLPDPVNGCEVSLLKESVPGDDLTYMVTSTAEDQATGKTTTIVAYFRANESQYEAGGSSPFDYAVATLNGDLTMTGSSSITGDCNGTTCNEGNVWVNGNINLAWTPTIAGDANVTGTCNRPGNIGGTYTPGSDPIERPTWLDDQIDCYISSTDVTAPACSGGTLHSGDWNLNWGTEGTYTGTHRVERDMKISGTGGTGEYIFTGPVCVGRNLEISSGVNKITFKAPVTVGGYADFGGTGTVIFDNPDPEQTIPYASHAIAPSYSLQGSAINVSGYSATVILTAGTCGSGGSVDVKLQDSYDGSTWTDVSPCGSFLRVTEANDNTTDRKNYTGVKPYLRAVATVSGATCQFGVTVVRNTTLHVREYLKIGGSRSAWFDGPVVVSGAALTSGKIVDIGGAKYSGVAWDMVFKSTLRATEPTPNCNHKIYLGGSKVFQFYDVVYTNVSAELAGATGSNMTFTKAFIADCNITVSGSSNVDAPPTTSPIFCARTGNVDLSGATLVDAIVYAPEGNVHVSGSSQLEGAIVAESALLEGAIKLKYPVVLRDRDDLDPEEGGGEGASSFSMVSYSIQ